MYEYRVFRYHLLGAQKAREFLVGSAEPEEGLRRENVNLHNDGKMEITAV